MADELPSEDRTAWWATCDECLTNVVVYPHPERVEDVPDPVDWEGAFSDDCPVCGESLYWSSDEAGDVIRAYPIKPIRDTGSGGSEFTNPPGSSAPCSGDGRCPASPHWHGCFADDHGDCDDPAAHDDTGSGDHDG